MTIINVWGIVIVVIGWALVMKFVEYLIEPRRKDSK